LQRPRFTCHEPRGTDELERFKDIRTYAFTLGMERVPPDALAAEAARLGERRGLFLGDELVSIAAIYPLTVRLRGCSVSMGGLGSIATPPEHRGRGYAGRLVGEFCREMKERGLFTSALWPFAYDACRARRPARTSPPGRTGSASSSGCTRSGAPATT